MGGVSYSCPQSPTLALQMQKADSESRFGACGRAGGQVRLEASAGLAVFPSCSTDAVIARQEAAVRCKRETDKGPKFCPIWVALKRKNTMLLSQEAIRGGAAREGNSFTECLLCARHCISFHLFIQLLIEHLMCARIASGSVVAIKKSTAR